jgi:hypothetical protein
LGSFLRNAHKTHHRSKANLAIAAWYCSVTEQILFNLFPVSYSLLIFQIGIQRFTGNVWPGSHSNNRGQNGHRQNLGNTSHHPLRLAIGRDRVIRPRTYRLQNELERSRQSWYAESSFPSTFL